MARVATRVQALEGIQSIEVTEAGLVVIYDPGAVTLEAITSAFSLQGLDVRP